MWNGAGRSKCLATSRARLFPLPHTSRLGNADEEIEDKSDAPYLQIIEGGPRPQDAEQVPTAHSQE